MDARYLITYDHPGRPHRQPRAIFGRYPFLAWQEATTKAEHHPEWVENVELFERRGRLWVPIDTLPRYEDTPTTGLDSLLLLLAVGAGPAAGDIEVHAAGRGPTRQAAVNVRVAGEPVGSVHLDAELTATLVEVLRGPP